ncbi:PDDEXK nuclease domain-containing protein [Parvibaculum sp.]|uniref:PDDEXK nuclease domain-containing protein n=1 Tax=Parvibaculum sp. TaxID=2024848 RepID=UPI003BA99D62
MSEFEEVLHLIESSRHHAFQAVNVAMIELYWSIGEHISRKIAAAEWGDGVVDQLAAFLSHSQPGLKGFSRQNLFRMRQFYEAYRDHEIVSALLRQLSWTHHLIILGQAKLPEEREFYMRMAVREKWSKRELERQFRAALFERVVLSPPKVSAALSQTQPDAASVFKDSYVLEFLGLPDDHSESDLHRGLLKKLRDFITELGRDFCFMGSEVPLQVGKRDFALDLLFFHRGMNCLVALELKIDRFEPEHLGKLGFYLEALDRDVKKPHENPSIGVLLCASKDSEVVEYALSRSLSPALIAEYQTQLPDRALLQRKLHEFYQQLAPSEPATLAKPIRKKRQ